MWLIADFDFVDGAGHLREQSGIAGIVPVDELSGGTFYAREQALSVPSVRHFVARF